MLTRLYCTGVISIHTSEKITIPKPRCSHIHFSVFDMTEVDKKTAQLLHTSQFSRHDA